MIPTPPPDGKDMADAERRPGSSPQDLRGSAIEGRGVETSNQPQYQELLDNPGLEVVQPSTLEVAPPKSRPVYTPPAGWEKKGSVPDDGPYRFDPQPPYTVIAPPTYIYPTPHDNSPLIPSLPALPAEQGGQKKIIGVKQTTFYILLAIGVFFGVAAIAVGVGVGIVLQKGSGSSETRYVTSSNSLSVGSLLHNSPNPQLVIHQPLTPLALTYITPHSLFPFIPSTPE
jgi:hypothetical protein